VSVTLVPRSSWGALPAEGFTPSDPSKLDGVGVHWWGSPDGDADHTLCDDLMRTVQRGHLNHPTENYTDIAYNFCVCPHGSVYEGRGYHRRTGANGYSDVNKRYGSVCVMLGAKNPPAMVTELAKEGVAHVISGYRRLGAGAYVGRHGYWTGSACPGPTIGPWVDSKGYTSYLGGTPMPETNPIPDWLDDWLYWRFVLAADPAKRPANVPDTIKDWAWDFAAAVHRVATHSGMAEGEEEWIAWKRAGSDPATRPAVPTTIPKPWWDDLAFVNSQT
jgi:hypothetical protein